MKTVFLDRHGDLRSGWKILAFLILASTFVFAFTWPMRLIDPWLVQMGAGWMTGLVIPVFALGGVILASFVVTRWLNRKPFASVGLWVHERAMRECVWGVVLGFLMMASIFVVLFGAGYIEMEFYELELSAVIGIVLSAVVMFAAGAMLEEVAFRGYPFQTLIQGVTLMPAVVLMAALFSAAHLGNPNTTSIGIINIGLAAIWLSFAYLRTKGLWLPFGLHFGWNFSQTTIFSFPTSGIEFAEYKLFGAVITGPEWLTGGAFGPEGGAIATVTLIVSTFYVLKSKRFEAVVGIITLDSVEDLAIQPAGEQGRLP